MNDDEPVIRINISREAFDLAVNGPPDPESVALQERVKNDPGPVTCLGWRVHDNGRTEFFVGLDCLPAGDLWHVMSEHYPVIVGALKAQDCKVRPDSVLTLTPNWAWEDDA